MAREEINMKTRNAKVLENARNKIFNNFFGEITLKSLKYSKPSYLILTLSICSI